MKIRKFRDESYSSLSICDKGNEEIYKKSIYYSRIKSDRIDARENNGAWLKLFKY